MLKSIKPIITDALGMKATYKTDIMPETRIVENLGIDSLTRLVLVENLEKTFNCHLADEECMKMATVQDIMNLVNKSRN